MSANISVHHDGSSPVERSLNVETRIVCLGDIVEFVRNGKSIKQTADAVGLPITRIETISHEVVDPEKVGFANLSDADIDERWFLEEGDILFSHINSLEHIGKTAIYNGIPEQLVHGMNLLCIRPNPEYVEARYLLHTLREPRARKRLRMLANKAVNQASISATALKAFQVPLPPLEEQRRIAAILDKADALRVKRREAIAKLDQLLQSVFLEMFGDPVTNPMGWPLRPLSEFGSIDRGVSKHRPRNDPALLGGDHPLIQTGDVANSGGYIESWHSSYSDLGLSQSKKWPVNTLCITIAANIANTGILKFEACFPDSVVGFVPNASSTVEYVQGIFGFFRKILDEKAPMSAQKNINLKILRALEVPAPPVSHQVNFSNVAAEIEACRSRLMRSENQLDHLASAIEQKLFKAL